MKRVILFLASFVVSTAFGGGDFSDIEKKPGIVCPGPNQVVAGPDGAAGKAKCRSLVPSDVPGGTPPGAHGSTHNPNGSDPISYAAPVTLGTVNAVGTANSAARSDHTHADRTTAVTPGAYPATGQLPVIIFDGFGRATGVSSTTDGSNILFNGTNIQGPVPVGAIPSGLPATLIANGSVSNSAFQFIAGLTSDVQAQLNLKQPLSAELTAIANLTGLGFAVRTGPGTWVIRQLNAGQGTSVNDANGAGANPSINVLYGDTLFTAIQGNSSRVPPVPGPSGNILYSNGTSWVQSGPTNIIDFVGPISTTYSPSTINVTTIEICIHAADGAGGSGRVGIDVGSGGGRAGAGGGSMCLTFKRSDLDLLFPLALSGGGPTIGGAAQTVNLTNGNVGGSGGAVSVGSIMRCTGGGGGLGGSTGSTPSIAAGTCQFVGQTGGAGNAGNAGGTGNAGAVGTGLGGAGGGGGGGSAGTFFPGGSGGFLVGFQSVGASGGLTVGAAGQDGTAYANYWIGGSAGGGGASGDAAGLGNGGRGGDAGCPGGSGGGGGGAVGGAGAQSGRGGNGCASRIRIIERMN